MGIRHVASKLTKITLGLALLAGSTLAVRGDDKAAAAPEKQTLDSLIQLALRNQPSVAAAKASMNSTAVQREAAYAPMAIIGGPIIHVRRQQADIGVHVAQASLAQAELETMQAVTRNYLSVLYAQEQAAVAQEAVDKLKATENTAKSLAKDESPNATQSDVDRISIYARLAEGRRSEASLGLARAQGALREAVGLAPDAPLNLAPDKLISYYDSVKDHLAKNKSRLSCEKAISVALLHRPEITQATGLADITNLEICAQGRSCHPKTETFAANSDIHAKVLPATEINGDYRPGMIAPEMPVQLAGSRKARQERALWLTNRANSLAEKVRGLIALEVRDACERLNEQATQVELLRGTIENGTKLAEKTDSGYRAGNVNTEKQLTAQLLVVQSKSQYNEALYKFGIALGALQKATAYHIWECTEPVAQPK